MAESVSLLQDLRRQLKDGRNDLSERFHAGEPVEDLVRKLALQTDSVLQTAWHRLLPAQSEIALVAVGGFGRGELHPASDIDVLVLTRNAPEPLAAAITEFVTFLWDLGLEIGHSVRSLEQCVEEARKDVTIATNLMESRLLAGDPGLFKMMRTATGPRAIWDSAAFFKAKCEEQRDRHARYQDSAQNLEPNIKGTPGGLRDIQMIGWVAKRHFGASSMADLVSHGFLTDSEFESLSQGQSFLWRIRFALHLLSGRHDDRLLFEYQRSIAREFGYLDDSGNLAVERFMQRYYQTVQELAQLNEMLLRLFEEEILLQRDQLPPQVINARFQMRHGYLEVRNPSTFAAYPLAMLEMFLLLQQHPDLQGISAGSLRLLRAHLHLIDRHLRTDIRANSLFMEILRQPEGVTHALRRMGRYGVLARYIPAFGKIQGLMQFDLFHVFTVDIHTLTLVSNLRRVALPRFAHELPQCSAAFRQIPKPELLYLAGLFHDIAKGRGGDHSILGGQDAWDFCKQHHLSDYDAGLVRWLVENHLIMSLTAQREDIEDPAVIGRFAARVGDVERLTYLFLLTVADMRATSPQRWNSWKESLLNRLYQETKVSLARGIGQPLELNRLIQDKQNEAKRLLQQQGFTDEAIIEQWMSLDFDYFLQQTPEEIAWHTGLLLEHKDFSRPLVALRQAKRRGADELFICLRAHDGLFAQTTSLLHQLGLNVHEARIQTNDINIFITSFFVLEQDGSFVSDGWRGDTLVEQLRDALGRASDLRVTPPGGLSRRVRAFVRESVLTFRDDPQSGRTILQVNSMDRPGLLSSIAQVFCQQELQLRTARITTFGAVAEDSFALSERHGDGALSSERRSSLAEELKRVLDG